MGTTDKPLLVLAGIAEGSALAWVQTFKNTLQAMYRIAHYDTQAGYVPRLTDDHAALIVVDGDDAGARYWCATAKASPATRRIPVFAITENAERRFDLVIAGADMVLSSAELHKDGTTLINDFARVLDPEHVKQLDCDCKDTLPDLAKQGVEKFNAGEFYPQHDLFEELWMATESPVRDLYRAILQVGVAYYQIERGNHRGARKMLLRSVQWLSILPDVCQGIDVKALREDSARVRFALEHLPEDEIDAFDRGLLQPIKYTDN